MFLLLSLLAACTPEDVERADSGLDLVGDTADDTGADADESDRWFDPDRVLEVEVEIDGADWDEMRVQGRNFFDVLAGDCLAEPFEDPFTWFESTITVDGQTTEQVGLRKKGFIGSLSDDRPSLKFKFDKLVEGQTFGGMERMTFNNGQQDPSRLSTCVAYGLFDAAGVPAPRCNFAHVTVNGEDMGVFAHVESIKKDFLRRHFDDADGDLYEGTLSDFRDGWTGTFEAKTDDTDPERAFIAELQAALGADDDALVEALEAVIDLDAFLDFFAMEVLLLHWDGYSGNTNNFFVYRDPTTGLGHFIPWGPDAALEGTASDLGAPASVFASSRLAHRIYTHDALRDRYEERLLALLDGVWDEAAILDEIDRMEALIADRQLADARADSGWRLDNMREAVSSRRDDVWDEIDVGGVEVGSLGDPPCVEAVGSAQMDFSTTWSSLNTQDGFSYGDVEFGIVWEGYEIPVPEAGMVAGSEAGEALLFGGGFFSATEALAIYVGTPEERFTAGAIELDLLTSYGVLLYYDAATMTDFAVAAYIGGDLVLETAETSFGGEVTGSVDGPLYVLGF